MWKGFLYGILEIRIENFAFLGGNTMDELHSARLLIDQVDQQMAELFCQRMAAVKQVAAYKAAHHLPVLDASREEQVVNKNLARLSDPELAPFYEEFIRSQMALSRLYQAQLLKNGPSEKKDG